MLKIEQKCPIWASRGTSTCRLLCIWALCLASWTLSGCAQEIPDEQRIRQRIDSMLEGAGNKSLSEVLEPVAESFTGNGRVRKINLKALILLYYRRHKNVHVLMNDLRIEITGTQAQVQCAVLLAGRGEKLLPEQARLLKISAVWQKQDDDWYVVSAQWRDPLLDL